jgi:hypothetical protein
MKIEIELLDRDFEDRKILGSLREMVLNHLEKLSDYGKNTIAYSRECILADIEGAENEWINCQRERVLNSFSQALNTKMATDELD